jgi:hypothetical protein
MWPELSATRISEGEEMMKVQIGMEEGKVRISIEDGPLGMELKIDDYDNENIDGDVTLHVDSEGGEYITIDPSTAQRPHTDQWITPSLRERINVLRLVHAHLTQKN